MNGIQRLYAVVCSQITSPTLYSRRSRCGHKKMEALVFDGTAMTLKHHKDFPIPQITTDDDVIVKIEYAGVCGTDVHIIKGEFPARKSPPFPLGHESAGVIHSVSKKSHFKAGQKVAIYPCCACNICDFCRLGQYHHCPTAGLNSYIGIFRDGGWAQYCLVPQQQIYVLPECVTTIQGALAEPISCVVHTFNRACPMRIGSRVLILGAGIIGNLFASAMHHHGHRDVTICEKAKSRLTILEGLNLCYRLVDPDELAKEGTLFDIIVDCTGLGKVMEISFNYMKPGGKYIIFGCCPPTDATTVNPYQIFDKELTIIGAKINPFTFFTALKWIDAMGDRYVNYSKLGVKTYRLSEYESALDDLKSGSVSKAVFKFVEDERC